MSENLWIRKWKILITDKNDKEALNLSELHCIFSITKKRELQNYARISIYNLNEDTEKKIIQDGYRLIIEAGYEGTRQTDSYTFEASSTGTKTKETSYVQYGKIFDGQIIYPTRKKENNTDYVLSLLCIDGERSLGQNFVAKTINRGINQRQKFDAVCKSSNTTIQEGTVTDDLSEQKTTRGIVLFGEPKDYISDIVRGNNADYWVEEGKVHISKMTDIAQGEALVISPKTGLIGTPQQTQFGVNFTVLLNPAIKMKTMVQIKNSEVVENEVQPRQQQSPLDPDWMYQVIGVTYSGDTRGNEWYTRCEAISRYGKGSLAALMANRSQNPNKT